MPSGQANSYQNNTMGQETLPGPTLLQPSRSGRDRRASDKLAAQINADQDAARAKAEQLHRRAEREKKARRVEKAYEAEAEDDDVYERRTDTFTSQVVASRPAALIQRTNKVPPASRTIVPQDESSHEIEGSPFHSPSPSHPHIQPRHQSPPESHTRGRSPSHIQPRHQSPPRSHTRGRSPSHIQPRHQSPPKSHTRGRSPSHIQPRHQSPPKSHTRGRSPSHIQPRHQSPPRSHTRGRSPSHIQPRHLSPPRSHTRQRSLSYNQPHHGSPDSPPESHNHYQSPPGGSLPIASSGATPEPPQNHSPSDIRPKRKHNDSSDAEDEELAKAQKIDHHRGRPRARDYDDVSKELILQAAKVYRCLLSCQDAFPDLASEAEMVKMAWEEVNRDSGLTPMGLSPDIVKIMKARGSQARGEIKEKTKALVEALYGFDSGNSRRAVKNNRMWAEELKHERGFVYKTISINAEGGDSERKGMYQHPIIQKAVNVMWFQNKRDEGIRFTSMFKPMPITAIALVLTAIEANIDEWLTGMKTPVTFWADEYRPIYLAHIDGLKEYGRHTAKCDLLGRLQRSLYNYGCHHAGVSPTEIMQAPVVPVSAYEAALKEYEENSETDDEGSMIMVE